MAYEYFIVEARDITAFVNFVNELLADGCIPQGGVTAKHIHDDEDEPHGHMVFYQAMLRPAFRISANQSNIVSLVPAP